MSRLAERSGPSVIWAAARNATIASATTAGLAGQVMTRALDKLEVSIRQPGAASSLSQPVRHPGPTLASRTTAATRPDARLAADSATPPP
jgi:hypothetical protein